MSIPQTQPDRIPDDVLVRSWNGPAHAVWVNGIGGITWEIGEGADREFVKHGPTHPDFDVVAEAARLEWAKRWLPVPTVLAYTSTDEESLLATAALPGETAVSPRNVARPEVVVPALGRALRRFHDALPVTECPFNWSVAQRLAALGDRRLVQIPAADRVVCHGDACNPNFLLDEAGECCGYVDLGQLGVADRHADLAPAILSLGWNFGEGWAEAFLSGYGLPVDEERLAFYTWLWEAEPLSDS
ncbi:MULTISPECIES: aminoglycoside 3'-phosphotransferase [unclassified Luteococcus]|uniref:aminoglycoside 3'-phosphotransferase n=1 Tax=unclassified Luteococcus TaxID=2639923 RepID=UPI00313C0231